MTSPKRRAFLQRVTAGFGSLALAGCGGGGAAADEAPVAGPAPSPAPAPAPSPAPSPAPAPGAAPSPPPPPLPAPTGAMAFSLVSQGAATLAPFSLGFAFRQGDVPSGQSVVGSIPNLQVIPKNRWGDGSLKFAVLSGRASLAAGTPLSVSLTLGAGTSGAVLTTAALKATGVNATVGCGALGSVSWSGADWDSPFQNWISGPEMSSWLFRKVVGSDAHLVAWLEVRLYAGGAVEVLPWIENGYLRVAGPTNKTSTYSFSLGGTQRFTADIALLNHQRTPLVGGTSLTHWLGSEPVVTVRHDTHYLQATRLVPMYRATVSPAAGVVTGLPATYTPLQQGSYPGGMGSAGYHGSIGLLPEWDVLYLCSTASTLWAAVQRNAYSAGRYGIHFRDETTNKPLRFSSHPTLLTGGSSGITGTGASSTRNETPSATGGSPPTFASTHHPSMGYMAYLVTGWAYHLETTQFVVTANYLKNGDIPRNGSEGVFQSTSGANTTRGVGWALRSLAQAAAITPDGDPLKSEFESSLSANVNWYHTRYVAQPNNPQGFIQPYSDYTAPSIFNTSIGSTGTQLIFPAGYVFLTDGYYNGWEVAIGGQVRTVTSYAGATRTATVSPAFTVATAGAATELRTDNTTFEAVWMQDFVTAALGYALALDPNLGVASTSKLRALFEWKARSVIGRFGGTGAQEYLYRDAGQYTLAVAPSNTADWAGGTGPWFANWGALYDETFRVQGSPGGRTAGGLRGGNFPAGTSYWGNLQPAIAYAVEHGAQGASEAYRRMVSADNWSQLTASFDTGPVWAVRPPVE